MLKMETDTEHGPPPEVVVRLAVEDDIPRLLPLMRALAEFERYVDSFAVTEDVLRQQGFRRSPPAFECLVAATESAEIMGMLVFYIVPFNANARPRLVIKELFVVPEARGGGIGKRLMAAARERAVAAGCGAMKWQVASWNAAARSFYQRLGAEPDPVWIDYVLPLTGPAEKE